MIYHPYIVAYAERLRLSPESVRILMKEALTNHRNLMDISWVFLRRATGRDNLDLSDSWHEGWDKHPRTHELFIEMVYWQEKPFKREDYL